MVTPADLQCMAKDPIVFAMANPILGIQPEKAEPYVRVMATERSGYPNQINNVLCFPGFFRGLLDCRAQGVTESMKVAAAEARAAVIGPDELHEDYIIPSVFDARVAPAAAQAVAAAAIRSGMARRTPHRPAIGGNAGLKVGGREATPPVPGGCRGPCRDPTSYKAMFRRGTQPLTKGSSGDILGKELHPGDDS